MPDTTKGERSTGGDPGAAPERGRATGPIGRHARELEEALLEWPRIGRHTNTVLLQESSAVVSQLLDAGWLRLDGDYWILTEAGQRRRREIIDAPGGAA